MSSIVKKSIFQIGVLAKAVYVGLGEPSSSKWQYNFDGIDDYVQLPVIPLFVGDVVELDIRIPNPVTQDGMVILADTTIAFRNLLYTQSQGVITAGNNNIFLDGVKLTENTQYPTDNKKHTIKVELEQSFNLNAVGVQLRGTSLGRFFRGGLLNLRITRANPTDQYPDLFYPMDDGPGTTVMRQTIPHNHKTDGTESFDTDGAVWLDYETEAAPQYVGVDGYETLAERAVLSGLSEHDEAVASCREGLVKNGDFRFEDSSFFEGVNGGILDSIENNTLTWIQPQAGAFRGVRIDNDIFNVIVEQNKDYVVTFDQNENVVISIYDKSYGLIAVLNDGDVFNTGANNEIIFYIGATDAGQFTISNVSLRKATEQQVLTPYVNQGEYVNFNEENWEND